MPTNDDESPLLLFTKLIGSRSENKEVVDEESMLLMSDQQERNRNANYSDLPSSAEDNVPLQRSNSLSDSWNWYNAALEKRPLLVKGITAFFILGLGDMIGQGVEHWRGTATRAGVDWPRSARFGIFGLLGAPWAHYYFYFLDYYLPPTEDPFTRTTLLKLLIDQAIQAPALLAFIISALSIMKGEGWEGVKQDMSETYVEALIANWKLWIPASLINMAFVKPTLRVLYVNVIFFVWTVILSVMLNTSSST